MKNCPLQNCLAEESPQAVVAALESKSLVFKTYASFGPVIWRRWGAGPPLLLLHGSHGSWLHWVRNIEELACQYTVLAPDLPGFGESSSPGKSTSAQMIAAPVAAALVESNLADLDILGFSFGGLIGAHVAALARPIVRRLVIVDSGGLGTPTTPLDLLPVRKDQVDYAAHRHNLAEMMIHDPARIDALALHVQAWHVPRGKIDVRPLVLPDGMIRALQLSDVPVDAIWGQYDRPHPDPTSQFSALHRERPAARCRTVENAGHWCPYENPVGFHSQFWSLGTG